MKILYVDMDGVLCDFEGHFFKVSNMDPETLSYEEIKEVVNRHGRRFWENMPWTEIGPKLWGEIKHYNVAILSNPANFKESKKGKSIWIRENLGEGVDYILAEKKSAFANHEAMLIDDTEENINSFEASGGHGVFLRDDERGLERSLNIIHSFFNNYNHVGDYEKD